MDDIKLFAKNEKELETLMDVVRIYSQDTGMEFGIEKCAMLVMKSGKRHLTYGMDNQIKTRLERSEKRKSTKHEGGLITAMRNDTGNRMANRMTINRKQK